MSARAGELAARPTHAAAGTQQPGRADVVVVIAVLAAAAALRPQLSGIGPLLDPLARDLAITHAEAGLLATIPVACMGLLAPVSVWLMRRHGAIGPMSLALICISVAGLVRALASTASVVIALTVAFGIGSGVAGTLLPAIVKARFAAAATRMTAAYSVAVNGTAALAAALAAPVAQSVGGWRGALAIFGAFDVVATAVWVVGTAGGRLRVPARRGASDQLGVSEGAAPAGGARQTIRPWTLAVVFGLQAIVFFGLNAWLADTYREYGWSAGAAGALVGVLNFSTLPATLGVAAAGSRLRGTMRHLAGSAGVLVVATLGIVLFPAGGFLWPALAGAALGTIFPLCMAAPVHLGRDPHEVARATGIMLGGGYLIAAIGPVVLGALRDSTGGFTAGIWMLVGVATILLAICGVSATREVNV